MVEDVADVVDVVEDVVDMLAAVFGWINKDT